MLVWNLWTCIHARFKAFVRIKVWAIEGNEDLAKMTDVTVSENGMRSVDVIHGLSTRVNLTGTEVQALP